MKTKLPDPRKSPRFAGICSFFRYPIQLEPKAGIDWAVYGVPFDGATTYQTGARFGPRGIRQASQYIKPYHTVYEQNLLERFSMVDAGDSPVSPFDLEANLKMHQEFAKAWRDKGAKTFAVGGDHSVALGNIRATAEAAGKPLTLVHFDSHTDTVDAVWGEKFTHASPIIRAVEEGLIEKNGVIQIGIKGPVNTSTEFDWGNQNGVELVTYDEWRKNGDARIRAFREKLKDQPVYMTFDIDSIDPTFAPGTGTYSMGGFTSAEVIDLIRIFRGINLVGGDLVEVSPSLDHGVLTQTLAAHLIFEIMSL